MRAQLRLTDRGGDDIRSQGEPRALELKALIVDQRLEAFELAAVAAKGVERVGNVHRGVIEIEDAGGRSGLAKRRAGDFLASGGQVAVDLRKQQRSPFRGQIFARLRERCLGRRERRVIRQRVADEPVQRVGVKERPPLRREVPVRNQALRFAAPARRSRSLLGHRCFGVAAGRGRFRPAEIGADHAARERQAEGQCKRRTAKGDHFVMLRLCARD